MNPELLVGVLHEERNVDMTDKLILERYPEGIESLMVQIPPNQGEWKDGFFNDLAERYKKRSTRIINGDLNRKPAPEYIRRLYEKTDHDYTFKDLTLIVVYQLFEAYRTLFFDGFLHAHELDKGVLKAVEIEQPQVIVVGRVHADYIKRVHPGIYYIAFTSKQIDSDWSTNIDASNRRPYKPEEIINLDTKK